MTIRSIIIAVFVVVLFLFGSMLIPYYKHISEERTLHVKIAHAQVEQQAVSDLLLAVSRKIKEVSDSIFLGEETPVREELEHAVTAGFERLEKFTVDDAEVIHNNDDQLLGVTEAGFYFELLGIYDDLKKSRGKIKHFHANGERGKALYEMENVYEQIFDNKFVPRARYWIDQEKEELQEYYENFRHLSEQYILHIKIVMGLACLSLFFLFFILNKIISGRLIGLATATRAVARGDLNTTVEVTGKDEISDLAHDFNEMTRQLSSSRLRLMDQCYLAGVNQSSADILHNIRNSFSSLTLGCEHITGIVNTLASDPAEQQGHVVNLQKRIEKMKDVVVDMAGILESPENNLFSDESMERYHLRDLITDSTNLINRDLLENINIYTDPAVETIGKILTHRIIFIQILSNLMANGCESISRRSNSHGAVRISAFIDEEDQNMIHLYITDNGEGIVAEDLEKIFERHFSTKRKKGLTGLGLAWCANAVSSLNGKMYADSDGLDKGATFHLLIPRI